MASDVACFARAHHVLTYESPIGHGESNDAVGQPPAGYASKNIWAARHGHPVSVVIFMRALTNSLTPGSDGKGSSNPAGARCVIVQVV